MNAYLETQPLIDAVWGRLTQRIDTYPARIAELSRGFFGAVGPTYFSQRDAAPILHLPAWLGRNIANDSLLAILEGTALAYASIRVQDNVIDEPTTRGHAPLMLAANAWLWDARELWGIRGDSVFSRLAREAWLTFSDETEAERRQLSQLEYPTEAFTAHARKCTLAEIPLYAVMASARNWHAVEHVGPLVHALALSYGRFNDVTGVERDLAAGANTFLLSQARASTSGGDPASIRQVLQISPLIEDYLTAAVLDLRAAEPHGNALGMPMFTNFVADRSRRLLEMRDSYTIARLAALLAA